MSDKKNGKSVSVICEYNPFHYGHLYQLEQLKEKYSTVICIMSGDTVQRGEVAVADKYIRAKAAVDCGADLVISLPFPYCMLSARDFASAGVYIASAVCSDALAFGCEDDTEKLFKAVDFLLSDEYSIAINTEIKEKKNISFPRARYAVVEKHCGEDIAKILQLPNNILGIEYISAIKKGKCPLEVYTVKRQQEYMSSSKIRLELFGGGSPCEFLPQGSAAVYDGLALRRTEYLEKAVFASLLSKESIENVYEICGGWDKKILSAARQAATLEELYDLSSTSVYPRSKVRRAVLSAFFGIGADAVKSVPEYTCVLGANENGLKYLSEIRKKAKISVLTKPAHYKTLSESAQSAFLAEQTAERICALAQPTYDPESFIKRKPYIKKAVSE